MARTRPILAAVGAGVVLTLATAWAGLLADPSATALGLAQGPDMKFWDLEEVSRPGLRIVRYWHMQMSGYSFWIPEGDYQARKFDLASLPAHLRPASLDDLMMMAWYVQAGFPFPALSGSVHWKTQVNSVVTYTAADGILLGERSNGEPVALPLRPLWAGFIANIAVWSVAWWGAGNGIRGAVRRLRSRPGLCLGCGYSLAGLSRGSSCPECGRLRAAPQ